MFEEAIEAFLLQNGHRVTVCMEPDVTLEEKQQKAETDKLAQIKAGMSDDDLEKVIEVRYPQANLISWTYERATTPPLRIPTQLRCSIFMSSDPPLLLLLPRPRRASRPRRRRRTRPRPAPPCPACPSTTSTDSTRRLTSRSPRSAVCPPPLLLPFPHAELKQEHVP